MAPFTTSPTIVTEKMATQSMMAVSDCMKRVTRKTTAKTTPNRGSSELHGILDLCYFNLHIYFASSNQPLFWEEAVGAPPTLLRKWETYQTTNGLRGR